MRGATTHLERIGTTAIIHDIFSVSIHNTRYITMTRAIVPAHAGIEPESSVMVGGDVDRCTTVDLQ